MVLSQRANRCNTIEREKVVVFHTIAGVIRYGGLNKTSDFRNIDVEIYMWRYTTHYSR